MMSKQQQQQQQQRLFSRLKRTSLLYILVTLFTVLAWNSLCRLGLDSLTVAVSAKPAAAATATTSTTATTATTTTSQNTTPTVSSIAPPHVLQEGEMLHLVKTRFMQHQGTLRHLAEARLQLFQAVCLPSMLQQSIEAVNVAWIISVDPDLDLDTLTRLAKMVKPYPHIYITLTNDAIKPGGGLHGIGERIVTGHVTVLRNNLRRWKYHAAVLETQLDADDALHKDYLAQVQQRAKETLLSSKTDNDSSWPPHDWMYWCIGRDIEWHWNGHDKSAGTLLPSKSFVDKKCYTPGMTLGVRGNATTQVLDVPHSALYAQLQKTQHQTSCGGDHTGLECLQFVDQMQFPALRARTPTSASMVNVKASAAKDTSDDENVSDRQLWQTVQHSFGVNRERLLVVHNHFTHHMTDIIADAIQGQCSHGHSCRQGAQDELQAFLQLYKNNNATAASIGGSMRR